MNIKEKLKFIDESDNKRLFDKIIGSIGILLLLISIILLTSSVFLLSYYYIESCFYKYSIFTMLSVIIICIALSFFSIIIFIKIFKSNDTESKLIFGLLFIPCALLFFSSGVYCNHSLNNNIIVTIVDNNGNIAKNKMLKKDMNTFLYNNINNNYCNYYYNRGNDIYIGEDINNYTYIHKNNSIKFDKLSITCIEPSQNITAEKNIESNVFVLKEDGNIINNKNR